MRAKNWFHLPSAVMIVVLSLLACTIPTPPPATLSPLPFTATPFVPATSPTTLPPTIPPTEPPPPGWLPAGTIALYTAGPWDSPRIYALAADGSAADLGHTLHYPAVASRAGRWIAYPSSSPPASSVTVVNLESGTSYTIPTTPNFTPYGLAFDLAEARLAFMELGGPDAAGYTWAIVVVNLSDGSTTRFEAALAIGGFDPSVLLPGNPVGWSASGGELLLNTFMPDTEGNWGGVWGITLPPGAPAASMDTLPRRQLVAGGDYFTDPRLSPDGVRLLYLHRDFDYMPAGYEVMAYDLAVNQLWTVDLASGARTLLIDVTDGGALARAAAWSPDGTQILFAQGNYAGEEFISLALKARDNAGAIRDIGPAPLPPGGGLQSLSWCTPGIALVTVTTVDYEHQLHTMDLASGGAGFVTSAEYVSVLVCIPE